MKTKSIRISLAIGLLLFSGCSEDFLNIAPPASLTEDIFFKTPADAEATITAAYRSLLSIGQNNNYAKVTEAPTDDVIIFNTQGLSLDSWSFGTNDAIIDEVWQSLYEGIFRANIALQKVPDIEMEAAQKDRILGEAHFLRALFYFHLTVLYGEVPLVTEADPTDASKAALPKSPLSEIQALMIDDLTQATGLLPLQSGYSEDDLGRASKGAAEALLGKVYLYSGNYPMAETHLNNVIISNEYELLADFSELLVVDNNVESIFEVQLADLSGQGSSRIQNDYPQGQGGFANLLPTQDIVDEFEDYAGPTAINGKDPRLFYSIFREGDPYDEVAPAFSQAWTPTGYAKKKGQYPVIRFNNGNLGRNFPLIRLADVLLMYAEAANENDNPGEAIAAINKVRDRVGMPNLPTAEYPVSNKQEIFEAIVHERRVELAFEYHRLNDLRRWGLAEAELGSLGYVSPKHLYYPIPQSELDNNPELVQTAGY